MTSNPVIFIQYWKKKKKKKKSVLTNNYEHCLSYRNENGCTAIRIGTVANEHEHTSYLYTENSGVLAFGSNVVTAIKQCRDNSGFTRVPSSVLKLTTSRPFLNPSWSHFFLFFYPSSSLFFAYFSLTLSLSLFHNQPCSISSRKGYLERVEGVYRSFQVKRANSSNSLAHWRNRSLKLMLERYF